MYKIMLIEDDKELSNLIKECLERYEYDIVQQQDFKTILDDFISVKPDLVLLDINLPYYDGYFLCKSIRKLSMVPIIIMSARSAEMDQIMAIELGADDYITKPLTFDLLHSKIKATIRRVYGEYSLNESSLVFSIGDLKLDETTLTITYRSNSIELSKNECKLLKKFIENKDRYVTREELIEEVWDDITFVDDNTLTVNITRIKQKLANLGLSDMIKSKRGVGYKLQYQSLLG
ncbi:response regulator transcription factor [Halalkalibacter okhensis]|uniref:Transcriptional regulator n=1 Tax=Halalkalibacter okhensis TaxID=333138 RepID=A0A0B0IE90_9BACI|nr:response regulator transcription factor [Halalkalibacter okhensis]KHF39645.1 transcriptional regulator [Halalkalibacter okhensis]